jgi:hypothetical protein
VTRCVCNQGDSSYRSLIFDGLISIISIGFNEIAKLSSNDVTRFSGG